MFGPEPPSVDTKNSNAKYEELIFYLYVEYKDICGGGGGQGTRPVADVVGSEGLDLIACG
jgi:hypothetical protein